MQTKKHHTNKIINLGLIVLFITLLVSYFYKKGLLVESPIKLPLVIPTPSPVAETYKSDKYKFMLTYPSRWKVSTLDLPEVTQSDNIPDNSILFQLTGTSDKGKFEVLVWKNLNKTTVTDWVGWYLHEEIDVKTIPKEFNYSLKGNDAIQFIAESKARKKPLHYIFLNNDNRVFEFIFERDDLIRKEVADNLDLSQTSYDQIIKSFQFINVYQVPKEAEEVVLFTKENLSQRINLPVDQITVTDVLSREWNDSSLGCGEKGKAYLQVITPGFAITLQGKGKQYIYHTDLEKNVVFCSES